jgi:hypothetical protein
MAAIMPITRLRPSSMPTEYTFRLVFATLLGVVLASFFVLDTKTWHKNDPQISVNFKTRGEKEVIKETAIDSFQKYTLNDNALTFEPNYAPRFAKAFKHAVELCGGKPSAF